MAAVLHMVAPLLVAVALQPGTLLPRRRPTPRIHFQIMAVVALQPMNPLTRVPRAHPIMLQGLAIVLTMLPLLEKIFRLHPRPVPTQQTATVMRGTPLRLQEVHLPRNSVAMRQRPMVGSPKPPDGKPLGKETMDLDMKKVLRAHNLMGCTMLEDRTGNERLRSSSFRSRRSLITNLHVMALRRAARRDEQSKF